MQLMYNALLHICRDYPLREKIIIMPSHFAGAAFLRSFALKEGGFLNLRTATISSLVSEMLAGFLPMNGLKYIPGVLAERKMHQVISQLAENNELSYFNRLEITPGISGAILKAVQELKEAGFNPENIFPDKFVVPAKGEDIRRIYAGYEQELAREKVLDRPGFLRLFLKYCRDDEDALSRELRFGAEPEEVLSLRHYLSGIFSGDYLFLVPANLRATPLEKKILHAILSEISEARWRLLPLAEVKGLKRPGDYYFAHLPEKMTGESSPHPLRHLYKKEDKFSCFPGDEFPATDFFHSYGEAVEVREIIRRIKSEEIPFEDVIIYYTSREPYVRLLFEEACRCGIPVTFGEGVEVSFFRPGRLLFALTAWLKSDYAVLMLYRLLRDSAFKYEPGDGPGKTAIARRLRAAGIGWGRARYHRWLKEAAAELDKQSEQNIDLNNSDWYNHNHNHDHHQQQQQQQQPDPHREQRNLPLDTAEYYQKVTGSLKCILEELLADIPEADEQGLVCPGSLAAGLAALMEKRSNIAGEGEAGAYAAILDTLKTMAMLQNEKSTDNAKTTDNAKNFYNEKTTMEDALNWVERSIGALRVARSLPEPGSIHVDGYRNGLWSSGKRVFVTGLDARRFPGQSKEDPVLLNVERDALGNHLPMHGSRPVENLHEMVQLLAARGPDCRRLTLSFSSYDTVESREAFPSSLLLQVYRLVSHDKGKGYSELMAALGRRQGIIPLQESDSLSEAGWWMNRIIRQGPVREPADTVFSIYPHLKQGLYAHEQRHSSSFTPYDGKISLQKPFWEDGMTLSASRLEQLAGCPYSYFLRYVLKVSPPEDMVYDSGKWLDALSRGLLLHRVFEEFYLALLAKGEPPSFRQHQSLLEDIVSRQAGMMKEDLPPAHPLIIKHECGEILASCHVFLSVEEKNYKSSTPLYVELTFGLAGGDDSSGQSLTGDIPPVKIDLPSGTHFFLRGKIDRVDRLANRDAYAVLDYKTGTTYAYQRADVFRGGRRLQPGLYGLAVEKILRDKGDCNQPVIEECGYLFPSLQGEGQRRVVSHQQHLAEIYKILDVLREILADGYFVMTSSPDKDCKFCEYSTVCQVSFYAPAVIEKLNNVTGGPLQGLKDIRDIP